MMSTRRRIRITLLVAGAPIALAGLVLAVKLASLHVLAGSAIDEYSRGSFESSASASESLLDWNSFEPWVAHFDRGTAYAGSEKYNEAIVDLERALAAAPADRTCEVAVNLSLSWEKLGDAYLDDGQFAGARRLYETAKAVIDDVGAACGESVAPAPDGSPDAAGRVPAAELRDAGARVDDKLAAADEFERREEAARPEVDSQLDELEQQNQDAAEEKAERETEDRGTSGDGGVVDRPW